VRADLILPVAGAREKFGDDAFPLAVALDKQEPTDRLAGFTIDLLPQTRHGRLGRDRGIAHCDERQKPRQRELPDMHNHQASILLVANRINAVTSMPHKTWPDNAVI
jgi:hypothetical protein